MLKFLLLAVLVLWLFFSPGVRKLLRSLLPENIRESSPTKSPEPAGSIPMVACAHCGVHLPSNEALLNEAKQPFCSEAHRKAGARLA